MGLPKPSPIDPAAMPLCQRLRGLWDHLGLGAALAATGVPADLADFVRECPERLAGVVLCAPSRLHPAPFAGVADRLLIIAAEHGPSAAAGAHAVLRLPGVQRVVLAGYDAPGAWSDAVAERSDEIAAAMIAFLSGRISPAILSPGAGSHAGISYRIEGSGPALMLFPFFLAPSQWRPVLARLAEHFTVVTLGGPYLGGVAALEDRSRMPTYRAMFRTLVDLLAPAPGEPILEVGCGAASLTRLLARRFGGINPIAAVDLNPFLLREAEALAAAEGLSGHIRFAEGNAEALPFPDNSFGCVYSVTVLEECDAGRALAEIVRVTQPGGRVGLVVRAVDVPQWWNLELPEALRRKAEVPPYSVGPKGVADSSLYRRMREAGLEKLVPFPALVTLDRPGGPIWRNREDHLVPSLSAEEARIWREARHAAAEEGLLFMAHPMHAAVAVKA